MKNFLKGILEYGLFWLVFLGQTLLFGIVVGFDSHLEKGFLNLERAGQMVAANREMLALATIGTILTIGLERIREAVVNSKGS